MLASVTQQLKIVNDNGGHNHTQLEHADEKMGTNLLIAVSKSSNLDTPNKIIGLPRGTKDNTHTHSPRATPSA